VSDHSEFFTKGINPECPNASGQPITASHVYSLFFETKKAYGVSYKNWTASGINWTAYSSITIPNLKN
jgi:hypothetical protein